MTPIYRTCPYETGLEVEYQDGTRKFVNCWAMDAWNAQTVINLGIDTAEKARKAYEDCHDFRTSCKLAIAIDVLEKLENGDCETNKVWTTDELFVERFDTFKQIQEYYGIQ